MCLHVPSCAFHVPSTSRHGEGRDDNSLELQGITWHGVARWRDYARSWLDSLAATIPDAFSSAIHRAGDLMPFDSRLNFSKTLRIASICAPNPTQSPDLRRSIA